jgi:hypothetical protein
VLGECGTITTHRSDVRDPLIAIVLRKPECTSQLQLLRANELAASMRWVPRLCGGWNPSIIHGHINWAPVTYTGRVWWDDLAFDGDVDLFLETDKHYGFTTANERGIELEFNFNETVALMTDPQVGGSWYRLREALNTSVSYGGWALQGQTPSSVVADFFTGGQRAIVTGLYGLDAVHDAHAELHPVWAIAVNTRVEATDKYSDEIWSMFVRNIGNEGMCSSGMLPYGGATSDSARTTFTHTFQISWPDDVRVDSVEVADSQAFVRRDGKAEAQAAYPEIHPIREPQWMVWVSFILPRPGSTAPTESRSRSTLVYGELRLRRWGPPPPQRPRFSKALARVALDSGEPEDALRKLVGNLSPANRERLLTTLRRLNGPEQPIVPGVGQLNVRRRKGGGAKIWAVQPTIASRVEIAPLPIPSDEIARRDSILVAALCSAVRPKPDGC